jgi:hypothetical protein
MAIAVGLKNFRLKVSVVPPSPGLGNNDLFNNRRTDASSHAPNIHWLDWFAEFYRRADESHILLGTSDVLAPEDADVAIYFAQPESPNDVVALKKSYPNLITIFVTYETAVGARYLFNPKNHRGYDAVITYNRNLTDNQRYLYLSPRAPYRHRIKEGLPFEQRRVACLVGTNRKMTYRSGLFTMRKGWAFSLKDWIDYVFCPGELISYRSQVGSACAQYTAGEFEIYGEGWELLPETRHIFKGVPAESTLNYAGNYRYSFAFENHSSDSSLISERIWDALWGDTVPVYIGNKHIDEFVPRQCFVDATQFDNPKDMLEWLAHSSEDTWSKYREAGRKFIRSAAVDKFLPESFAKTFLDQVITISSRDRKTL